MAIGDGCYNDGYYLGKYADVADAVREGRVSSGRAHFEQSGFYEGRLACTSRDVVPVRIPWLLQDWIFIFAIAAVVFFSRKRAWSGVRTALAFALPAAIYVYFPYLSLERVFIFNDISSDSLHQFWPVMNEQSKQVWQGHLPMWSFGVGMGQNLFPGWLSDPFALIGILLGPDLLPWSLGYLQVAKVLIAVACIAGFLTQLKLGRNAVAVGALCAGFCGHMISRSTWYGYATEVVIATFYLYVFERFARSGRYLLLAIATGLIGCLGAYFSYLYGLLFICLAVWRFYVARLPLFAPRGRVAGVFVAASIAGVMLSLVVLLPDLLASLGATRVVGEASEIGGFLKTQLLATTSEVQLFTSLGRALGPNLLGNAGKYTGSLNYLEAPLMYSGMLCLVGLAPLWVASSRRGRIGLTLFVAAAVGYHVLVYFRLILNAFGGPYFKISALWGSLGLAICAAVLVDRVEQGQQLSRRAIAVGAAGVAAALAYVVFSATAHGMETDRLAVLTCGGAALAFAVLLWAPAFSWRMPLLVAAVIFELAGAARVSMNFDRAALDGIYYFSEVYYRDGAFSAVERIHESDHSFYRVERDWNSVHLMDALMQNYFGTNEYMSFTEPSTVEFRRQLGFLDKYGPRPECYLKNLPASGDLLRLLGVKYFLSRGDQPPEGFTLHSAGFGVKAYETTTGEIGYFYTHAIDAKGFKALPGDESRRRMILDAAVVDDIPQGVAPPVPGGGGGLKELMQTTVQLTRFSQNHLEGRLEAPTTGVLFLAVPYDKGWHLKIDGVPRPLTKVNVGFIGAVLTPGPHTFELRYRTPGLLPGAVSALIAGLGLAVVGWRSRRRRRVEASVSDVEPGGVSPGPRLGTA